ncbi:hypothetical protein [Streptomyces sp. NBC_01462]|uniref:hypothetical protein n=1 Tax=Streptomyces sp. NBC_01462 TaxID=2903876 RepID=UPI002E34E2AF|nr:hypothetical protein [Streptomyces sp. NBC_01462]
MESIHRPRGRTLWTSRHPAVPPSRLGGRLAEWCRGSLTGAVQRTGHGAQYASRARADAFRQADVIRITSRSA